MLLVKAFLINVSDIFGSAAMIFLADLHAESNAQGDVDPIAIRCFRMKHESANSDSLNGQLVDVMNSSFALIFRNIQICAGVGSLCFFRLKILDLSQDSAAEGSYEVRKCGGFIRARGWLGIAALLIHHRSVREPV